MRIRRRQFITLLGGAAAWPLAASAQKPAMPVIGYLDAYEPEASAPHIAAFRKGLGEMGYAEGRNVAIEYRSWSVQGVNRAAEMTVELARRRVKLIVASNLNTALAAKTATTTIPIVFVAAGDPVATGLVASLNRPGGNLTGVSGLGGEMGAKRLGLLHELVPAATRFALLVNPKTQFADVTVADTKAAASAIGVQNEVFEASTNGEIDAALASLVQKRCEALVVAPAALFQSRRAQLTTLAAYHRLPALYSAREYIDVGGLMSYGASFADQFRQVGIYAGRILKGEKPADLPVMQSSKFELVINAQTARLLDLTVPPSLLAAADEVIE
jgi:putative tryptophan/tyrosine transport system substrate-binding protein